MEQSMPESDTAVLDRPPEIPPPLDVEAAAASAFTDVAPMDTGSRRMVRNLGIRHKILNLEAAMMREVQVQLAVKDTLVDGMYARTMFIPKGVLLIGAIHKREHLNFAHGDITVLTEAGAQRIKGGMVLVSQPGTKRVGYAHEDTIWTTVHRTTETDIDKILAELVCNDYQLYELEFLAPEGELQ